MQVSIRMNTKRLGRRTGGSGHYNLLITGILGQHPDVSNSRQPHKLGRFHKPTARAGDSDVELNGQLRSLPMEPELARECLSNLLFAGLYARPGAGQCLCRLEPPP